MRRPWLPDAEGELTPEVRAYVSILALGTRVGMAILILTFLLYVSGLAAPLIPIDRLPHYWGLRASEYLRQANIPSAWGWVRLLKFGDVLNYVGIALLAGLTVVCYVAIFPIYLRKRDTPYVLIVLAEIALLLLAASGLLVAGH